MKVLFITPDAELAATVPTALAPLGFEVHVHDKLVGMYPIVQSFEPQVLLLDGELPRIAIEAASKYLSQKAGTVKLPIVLLTARHPPSHDATDPALLMQLARAVDFVEKSTDLAPLARALTRAAPEDDPFATATTGEFRARAVSEEGKPLVLVADDDAAIGRLLGKILATRYSVTVVEDGASAIAKCKSTNFAAVFCDLKMPNVTGADVYRAVAQFDPALADRMVFVTAHQLDGDETEFFLGLKNHVIHKPFSMREVLALADALISRDSG